MRIALRTDSAEDEVGTDLVAGAAGEDDYSWQGRLYHVQHQYTQQHKDPHYTDSLSVAGEEDHHTHPHTARPQGTRDPTCHRHTRTPHVALRAAIPCYTVLLRR